MRSDRHPANKSATRRRSPVVENRQKRVRLCVPRLERFLFRINRELGLSRDATVVRLVSDAEMQRLNKKFRHQPKTTDVLSFPSATRPHPRLRRTRTMQLRGSYLGDIAISPVVARRNAKALGRTTPEEICILMLHGVLHLLGYDHETDRGEMQRVEAMLRNRLGLS